MESQGDNNRLETVAVSSSCPFQSGGIFVGQFVPCFLWSVQIVLLVFFCPAGRTLMWSELPRESLITGLKIALEESNKAAS